MKRGIVVRRLLTEPGMAIAAGVCVARFRTRQVRRIRRRGLRRAAPQGDRGWQNLNVSGAVRCTLAGSNIEHRRRNNVNLAIGAVISNDNPPIVHAVGTGQRRRHNPGLFGCRKRSRKGNAGAAVSGKSYQIKGTASGADVSNPQQPKPITKPFELDVTCP